MSNKPTDVVDHEHFFMNPAMEIGRFDLCLLKDGRVVVWDVDEDSIILETNTWEDGVDFLTSIGAH